MSLIQRLFSTRAISDAIAQLQAADATKADVQAVSNALGNKADSSMVQQLMGTIGGKADNASVATLTATVSSLATTVNSLATSVTALFASQNAFAGRFRSKRIPFSSVAIAYTDKDVVFDTPFENANYTVSVTIEVATLVVGLPLAVVYVSNKTKDGFKIRALAGVALSMSGTLNVIALHD